MSNFDLIVKGLHEIVGKDLLEKIAVERVVKVYWGTAPTGRIHIGYYIPLLKIAELVKAGCEVYILIADLHAMLDNLKSTEKQVHNRSDYYTRTIKNMLTQLNVDLDKVTFILGSTYQTKPEYTMDMYRLNMLCKVSDARHAGSEVVKQSNNPMMTGLLYPSLQALDEEYLHVDAQLGGIDQRKIFMFAREFLPKIGYRKRIHLMTPMVPGIRHCASSKSMDSQEKMSASDTKTKLDMLDTRNQIKKKIASAFCIPGDVTDNSILDILERVLFPLLKHLSKDFVIIRREEHGGPITFTNFNKVREAFVAEKLHPADLKAGIVHTLDIFIEPVRKEFESREWRQVLKHSYAED
uniref:tyrosine--tRNA ligase n=1 Tax=Marseillevirus LCMAC201 TaxID=2506605 RepID=A0A481YVZ0_9VIRU|nr:MAG: tyrosyl-tRNA synthetase [Marseillevirus LCMAC201]